MHRNGEFYSVTWTGNLRWQPLTGQHTACGQPRKGNPFLSLSKKKKMSLLHLFMYMAVYRFWLILKVKCTTYIKKEDDSALGSHLTKNERWL